MHGGFTQGACNCFKCWCIGPRCDGIRIRLPSVYLSETRRRIQNIHSFRPATLLALHATLPRPHDWPCVFGWLSTSMMDAIVLCQVTRAGSFIIAAATWLCQAEMANATARKDEVHTSLHAYTCAVFPPYACACAATDRQTVRWSTGTLRTGTCTVFRPCAVFYACSNCSRK